MSTTKRIPVQNELDVAIARLEAREVARSIGFSTVDQARISLAAGELARILSKKIEGHGEIFISGSKAEGHVGIQVISVAPSTDNEIEGNMDENEKNSVNSALSLVDECLVEEQGDYGTRVTLMKWLT